MATENNKEFTIQPENQPPNNEVEETVQSLSQPKEPVAENPAKIDEPPKPVQNDQPKDAEVEAPANEQNLQEANENVEAPVNEQKLQEANENAKNDQAAAPIDITEKDWQKLGQQVASLFTGGGQQRMYSPGIHSIQRLGQQQTINIGERTGVVAATMQTKQYGRVPVVYSGNAVYALRPGRRGGRFVRITNPELLADLYALKQVQPEKAPEAQQPGQAIKAEQPEQKLAEPKVPVEQPEAAAQKNGEPDVRRAQEPEAPVDIEEAKRKEQEAGRKEQVAGPVEPGAPVTEPGQPASKKDEILTVRLAKGTQFKIDEDRNLITVVSDG